MTSALLVEALAEHIEKAMAEYRYKRQDHTECRLTIHKYGLQREAYEEFLDPYIIIKPVEGNDDIDESTVKCLLMICIREEDTEIGYRGMMNIIEHLRQSLLSTVAIGKRFPVKRPLKWAIDSEPNNPTCTGYIALECNVSTITCFQELKELYT